MKEWVIAIACIVLLFPAAAAADSSALIVTGVAGTPEHAEKFAKWTEETKNLLVNDFGFTPNRVIVLADTQATKPEIEKAFGQLKQQLQPLDTFFMFFIGHGSYDTDYKFNIRGADLTAADYSKLLTTLNAGRIVIVNSTNASGGALENLSGVNRIVVTATRSGQEANDTVFYEHFLAGLRNAASDEDKDQKVSIWEAFKYTVASVDRFYKEAGRLSTEHAQISDNGAPHIGTIDKEVPVMARATTFHVARVATVSDPRLQTLLNERREIEQKIEALRINRASMPQAEYETQMEDLLVELALKNQQIRAQETQ